MQTPDPAAAAAYLDSDPLLHVNIRALLMRGAKLRYASEDGVFVESGYLALASSRNERPIETFLSLAAGSQAEDVLVHQPHLVAPFLETGRYAHAAVYRQVAYLKPEPPTCTLPPDTLIRPLGPEHLELVMEHYTLIPDRDYIAWRIEAGMLGAFVSGELAGFIGTHGEESMGLLVVLPAYRRRGLGEALECAMIGRQMARGVIPFGQVAPNNTASIALQQRLGLACSDGLVFWLSS